MVITYEQLIELGACEEERNSFKSVFGKSLVLPTELSEQKVLAQILQNLNFSFFWAKNHLLTEKQASELQIYATPAWNEYLCNPKYSHSQYRTECWLIMIQILTNTLEQK
jgi:hypothetical protein